MIGILPVMICIYTRLISPDAGKLNKYSRLTCFAGQLETRSTDHSVAVFQILQKAAARIRTQVQVTLVDRRTEFGDAVDEKAMGGEGGQQRLDLGRVIETSFYPSRPKILFRQTTSQYVTLFTKALVVTPFC